MHQAKYIHRWIAFARLFLFANNRFSSSPLVSGPFFYTVLFCTGLTAVTAWGADSDLNLTLPEPTGRVVIEISGNIKEFNGKNSARFDYLMLEKLGLVEIILDTPWTEAGSRFEGVLTRQLLEAVGAEGTEVVAEAADGYSVSLPITDLTGFDTLLALSMNGKKMRLRNKGPAWILYDAKDRPEHVDSILNSRMIWQLRELNIK